MARDGQETTMTSTDQSSVILPELLTLTGGAIAPIEALFEIARDKVRLLVVEDGRVSGALIDSHQTAVHGLAWLATGCRS